MTIRIDVKAEVEAAQKNLDDLQKRQVRRAAARALNRTASQVKTRAVRDIAKITGLTQKDVRPSFSVWKAHKNALVANVRARGRAIPLERFKARPTQGGVAYRLFGDRHFITSAFIRKDGKPGIWKRIPNRTFGAAPSANGRFRRTVTYHGGLVPRLPIRRLYGPSVPAMMLTASVEKALENHAAERWAINFPRELQFYLNKVNPK